MDSEKRQRLQAAGWTVGNASDFLGLTPAETELVELKVSQYRTPNSRLIAQTPYLVYLLLLFRKPYVETE